MSSITKISIYTAIFAGFWLPQPLGATVSHPLSHTEATTFSSAVRSATKGNWISAHRAASTLKDGLPAKILIWMDISRHGTKQSFSAIADFITKNPGWPNILTLRRRAEETVQGAIPDKAVLAWFDIYPPITTAGRIRLIAALTADGQKDKAQKLIRETWIKRNFGRKQERRFRRQCLRFLLRKDHVMRLDRLLRNGRFVEARRTVPLVDKPLQKLAMARIALNDFRGGVDWHIRQVPESMRNDPGLLYERARWRRRKGRDDAAYELLKDIPAGTPFCL